MTFGYDEIPPRMDAFFFCQKPRVHWEPYMCNLCVDEKYRGQGFGRQLVRLCEFVAKNHWG